VNLSNAQYVTLKAHLAANTTPIAIPAGSGNMVQIKDIQNPDNAQDIANWYNLNASPNYLVWRSSLSRAEVYHTNGTKASDGSGTIWNWNTYKAQSATEQNAWTQMFMGDTAPISLMNFRNGVDAIFSGSAQQIAQRDHIFGVGRRLATNGEKVFVTAITTGATANNGNEIAQARGSLRNPDQLGFRMDNAITIWAEGLISSSDITKAWSAT